VTDVPRMFEVLTGKRSGAGADAAPPLHRVGVSEQAVGGAERIASLAALFPNLAFEVFDAIWPEEIPSRFAIAIVCADAAAGGAMNTAEQHLRRCPVATQIVVVLRNADVENSRRLARQGAADVLPAPASETALALTLERLLKRESAVAPRAGKHGQMAAVLKAGGGVGATSLAVQLAAMLSRRGGEAKPVCLADLDVQFGAAALYLDVRDPFSVTDCLAAGSALEGSPFAAALSTKHPSGARLLAAPHSLAPLDILSPELISKLIGGLKREFAITITDLPSAWTAWTNRALQLADRIVLVTRLSVPHVHLVRRQLAVLLAQRLDDRPIILVCNAVDSEQQSAISLKAAERAIGRPFDIVIPDDSRVMCAAANQGLEVGAVKRGTRLERAIGLMADALAAEAFASLRTPGHG
jgi:pilus assembly protein CpaE